MSVTRLIGTIVVILVIYAIVSAPVNTANLTRQGVSQLGVAGDRVTQFLTGVVGGTVGSSSSSQTDVVPTGGIATGDGSTPID